ESHSSSSEDPGLLAFGLKRGLNPRTLAASPASPAGFVCSSAAIFFDLDPSSVEEVGLAPFCLKRGLNPNGLAAPSGVDPSISLFPSVAGRSDGTVPPA